MCGPQSGRAWRPAEAAPAKQSCDIVIVSHSEPLQQAAGLAEPPSPGAPLSPLIWRNGARC